jgi:hypothetical protein
MSERMKVGLLSREGMASVHRAESLELTGTDEHANSAPR